MRILLDTHIALWAVADTAKLPDEMIKLLEDEKNEVFLLKTLSRSDGAPKHNDPFDRMLLAQAKYEDLKFLTHDSQFPYYGEKCVMSV